MSVLSPVDRDDLMRWTMDAYEGGDELVRDTLKGCLRATAELLAVEEELEAERDRLRGLLLRAFRCLSYGEPQNRHPLAVQSFRRAQALYAELLPMYQGGELE